MSYKKILFGMLLLLAVPAESPALTTGLYTVTISGTDYCHSSVNKFKSTLQASLIILGSSGSLFIADDVKHPNVGTSLVLEGLSTNSQGTGGGFSFSQVDGVFDGTYKGDATFEITSFAGNIVATFSDGCTRVATIKATFVSAS